MKKTLLFLFSSITITAVYAQPNFTSADMPGVGDGDTLMYLNYYVMNNNFEAETGSGHTWDFSGLAFSTYPNFKKVDSFRLKTHNVSAPYVNATIEEYVKDGTAGDVNLFSYGGDTLYIHRVGGVASGAATYNPPLASIAFPITFNNSSVIHSDIQMNGVVVGERTTTALYDGFGTLQMPNGVSYSNVFRIIKTEKDTNFFTHGVGTTLNYIWYKQGGQVPLLRILYSGSPTLYFVHGLKAGGTTSTGVEETGDQTFISVYHSPNSFPNRRAALNVAPERSLKIFLA